MKSHWVLSGVVTSVVIEMEGVGDVMNGVQRVESVGANGSGVGGVDVV